MILFDHGATHSMPSLRKLFLKLNVNIQFSYFASILIAFFTKMLKLLFVILFPENTVWALLKKSLRHCPTYVLKVQGQYDNFIESWRFRTNISSSSPSLYKSKAVSSDFMNIYGQDNGNYHVTYTFIR